MVRTQSKLPVLKLDIWKKDGNLYFVVKDELLSAIAVGNKSNEELQREMQHGYKYIQELLDGGRISIWAAAFVEYGIIRRTEYIKTATYPPIKY